MTDKQTKQEMKQMVRLVDVDVNGKMSTRMALNKIKGVSFALSNAICKVLNLDKDKKVGYLSDKEIEEMKDCVKNPQKYKILPWLFNRRNDYDEGEDKHLVSSDLKFQKDMDIKRLKKIKSYSGLRHQKGLPLRGQRTKGHFRKGRALGVKRKK